MLRRLLRREPRRLFVGALGVSGRRDLMRHLEDGLFVAPTALERGLLADLNDMFSAPLANAVVDPGPSDLAYDIALQGLRRGMAADVGLGGFGVPLFWRPKVRLVAKLYELQSKKTKATFSVTQRMPWPEFLYRLLSWRVMLNLEHPGRRSDLEHLLRRAGERLKDWLEKKAT